MPSSAGGISGTEETLVDVDEDDDVDDEVVEADEVEVVEVVEVVEADENEVCSERSEELSPPLLQPVNTAAASKIAAKHLLLLIINTSYIFYYIKRCLSTAFHFFAKTVTKPSAFAEEISAPTIIPSITIRFAQIGTPVSAPS